MKKIIGLSCGRPNAFCETFLKEAAMGAEEFGISTEIIRAMGLKVRHCTQCGACDETGKCSHKDDADWILERTCVDDCALIIAVPCYHVRANSLFAAINEKLNHIFSRDMNILKKTRVGAIIGVGGSGYDGWTSLNLPMVDIFVQHTRKVVDRIQINNCAIREFNLWDRTDMTPVTYKVRTTDLPYEEMQTAYGPQTSRVDFFKRALARTRQLGRNVATAMSMPIEDVRYLGEKSGVECPVCHSNILHIHEDLPYVDCPCCAVRGEIVIDAGKMKVKWNEQDAKVPRFSYEGDSHHMAWLQSHYGSKDAQEYFTAVEELTKPHKSYGKIIRPEPALAAK
jgi:multimeric flavodoxin WrbA